MIHAACNNGLHSLPTPAGYIIHTAGQPPTNLVHIVHEMERLGAANDPASQGHHMTGW
jgi:hypothetical protein